MSAPRIQVESEPVLVYERKLGRLKAERDVLKLEVSTLSETLAYWQAAARNGTRQVTTRKAKAVKTPKRKPQTKASKGLLSIKFAVGCALPGTGDFKGKQRNAYLQATKKTELPAHDPAFGRMAA